ncbi:hypothetical protein WA026_019252 [Henosepilachna vigintioctopunctata]|uniref:Uncharacterized protein n=1 Tax=Henosepilachna vigintioctopunctata TaxID=420089 RepID=A0AAW1TPW5_9CUCU
MNKMKRAKVYRNTAIGEIQLLCNLAREVDADGRNVNVFRARFSDIERIRDEFDKQHMIIIDSLLQDEDADLRLEETIREGFLADYYEIKSIHETLNSDGSINAPN